MWFFHAHVGLWGIYHVEYEYCSSFAPSACGFKADDMKSGIGINQKGRWKSGRAAAITPSARPTASLFHQHRHKPECAPGFRQSPVQLLSRKHDHDRRRRRCLGRRRSVHWLRSLSPIAGSLTIDGQALIDNGELKVK